MSLNLLAQAAEETIIFHLVKKNRAETYWDMDRYFVDDNNQESGHFFRKNRKKLGLLLPNWLDDFLSGEKEINIIGVQSKVSQAKVLGIKLQQLQEHHMPSPQLSLFRTARYLRCGRGSQSLASMKPDHPAN